MWTHLSPLSRFAAGYSFLFRLKSPNLTSTILRIAVLMSLTAYMPKAVESPAWIQNFSECNDAYGNSSSLVAAFAHTKPDTAELTDPLHALNEASLNNLVKAVLPYSPTLWLGSLKIAIISLLLFASHALNIYTLQIYLVRRWKER